MTTNQESAGELRECPNPWCGSHRWPAEDERVGLVKYLDTPKSQAWCKCCGISGPECESRELAIKAWNTRPAAPSEAGELSRAEIDMLKDDLEGLEQELKDEYYREPGSHQACFRLECRIKVIKQAIQNRF